MDNVADWNGKTESSAAARVTRRDLAAHLNGLVTCLLNINARFAD